MLFFLEITNIWQKSGDFYFVDFFPEILIIHRLVCIFLWILVVLNVFQQCFFKNLLLILNFTKAVLSKTIFRSIFVSYDGVLCAKEIQRLGPMDLKSIASKENHNCQKLTNIDTFAKIISVTSFSV